MNESAGLTSNEETDEELVKEFLDGNRRAFESIFLRHRHRMYSLAYRFCGSQTEAEDLCQEIFLLAFRKAHTFKGRSLFSTWLYRLGVNRCKDHLRKKSRSREFLPRESAVGETGGPLEAQVIATDDPDEPQRRTINREKQEIVGAAIEQLSPNLRLPLVLHDMQGLHYHEIARILRIPMGTVKSRIFRGRVKLGESLKPYEELWKD